MGDYRFIPSRFGWVAVLILLPVFISLGFWQLQRASERQALNDQQDQRSLDPPVVLKGVDTIDVNAFRYRKVILKGHYDSEHQFLIDNQIEGGQPGYHVLVPFRFQDQSEAVLVNRGWVPIGSDRQVLPDVSGLPRGMVEIQGTIDLLYRVGFKLKGAEMPRQGWPSLVQVPEAKTLSEHLGYPVPAFQVSLAPAERGAYVRKENSVKLDPGKNRGYAVQWFLFAAVTLYLFIRASVRKFPNVHET